MTILDLLKAERPTLKESSLKAYMSSLRKLNKYLENDNSIPTALSFLMKTDRINTFLDDLKTDNTRKAYMNHIIVFLLLLNKITPSIEITAFIDVLRKRVDLLNKQYVDFAKTNEKTEKQEKNWMTVDEIKLVANTLKRTDFQAYACIMIHLHIPMRNDLPTIMKITKKRYDNLPDERKNNTNAIVEIAPRVFEFRLNDYKTNQVYKETVIPIPTELTPVIVKLIKFNSMTDNLITNPKTGDQMSKNEYTRYLNNLFQHTGKKISSCILRNIVLSEKYGETIKDMKVDANNMMHSTDMQRSYIKC